MEIIPNPVYLLFLLLALPCSLIPQRAAAQPAAAGSADEAQLLLQIKRAWGDPAVLAGWNDTAAPAAHCSWPYVTCDTAGRVTNLSLANTNVSGPVSDAVGGLSSLAHLNLYNNSISGGFPTSVYRCASLSYLNLSDNYLGGELPADIGVGLGENLTTLGLNGNYFTGTIPKSLSRLRKLECLTLDNNRLTGTIPAELGDLTSLTTLTISTNKLEPGQLPASFKNLTKLTTLMAMKCNLVGDIPAYVADMPDLETLDLAVNNLTGSIPPGIWSLKKLQYLFLFANNLNGDIVVADGAFAAVNLVYIDLSANPKLGGPLPQDFGLLQKLEVIHLYFNNFSGEIPASIGRLPSLKEIKLFNNSLTGVLPPELGQKSPDLADLQVDFNEFTGPIPEGLCDNGKFQSFTAARNLLNGSIPERLAGCTTLQTLTLGNNQLSGEVPEALWTAAKLQYVELQNNRLTGTLPSTMYSNLSSLTMENNQFRGSIPAAASALQKFIAGNNNFSGEIPASLGNGMPMLLTLNLSCNQLSGGIPESFAKLKVLTQLDLSKNQLSGEIPAEMGAMPVLNVLDLSSNRLSGDIPSSLASQNLNSLNLSSNQLSGQVPAKFATAAYALSFLDNPTLCTSGLGSSYLAGVRSCNAGSPAGASSGGVSPGLRSGLLVAGAALLLVIVALAFFAVRDIRRRRKRVAQREDWKITPFQPDLGFSEAAILRGLTEENLVGRGGSGSVYRVAYTNRYTGGDGALAVKKIRTGAAKVEEKLEREFESEARILGNIRHNNIVRLLCCVSGTEAKLLVYDYMDNGSLDGWLHGCRAISAGRPVVADVARTRSARGGAPALDWPTRLRVAVGVAQGLYYMHHECTPPIVHRDVKTSNILLDSEFRAKVADFGLARMLCGYTRKVDEKVDVYSFGVVLLELTTGKAANDGGEHGSLADWARHHYQSGGSIPDATDQCIRYAGYSDEIEVVFRLGVMCTGATPSSRPTMKDVLQILVKCSEQTPQKCKAESGQEEYEVAPLLLPHRGSRRKQPSNAKGADNDGEERSDFDTIV
uniref:non-specific serine/threonine protein kinase n=1 Tax=Oryza punctata TaxID=4537 RepID=A0A0E0JII1_ORYPU